jgi:MFS family permease
MVGAAGVTTRALASPSYRSLLTVPGFTALAGSALLSRTANRMWEVSLVLYVLERFHSAALAGLTVFLSVMPGLLLSPVSGALLDRHGRRRLIAVDNVIAAAALASIGLLGVSGVLTPEMLLPIVALASLTFPLSNSGTRSLFPTVVPRGHWDLGNAVDSGSEALASVGGPALAGAFVALLGGPLATLASGGVFLLAALAVLRVPEPPRRDPSQQTLMRAAFDGLRYVAGNATLRGVAAVMSVGNLAYGMLVVILPVLVITRLHAGAAVVGALWALQGVATVAAGLSVGRLGSVGRERRMLTVGFLLVGCAFVLVLVPGWAGIVVAMLLFGASIGPIDIALFGLRQRRTDPSWFGRAFAVSMSLNFTGVPIGSAIAGPLVVRSTTVSMLVAALCALAAAGLCLLLLPRDAAARPVVAATDAN